MDDIVFDKIREEELKKLIDDLRDILNEICSTVEVTENYEEKLIVSEWLDQIIVEYMKQIKKRKK